MTFGAKCAENGSPDLDLGPSSGDRSAGLAHAEGREFILAHRLRPAAVTCTECGAAAREGPEGWRAFVVGGYDGEDVEIVVFCPDCAEREAGSA